MDPKICPGSGTLKKSCRRIQNKSIWIHNTGYNVYYGICLSSVSGGGSLQLGDRVIVASTMAGTKTGTLRYLGPTDFAKGKGEWAGIELDAPLGKNINQYTKTVTLRYLGPTDFAKGKGEWAGIELDAPLGKNINQYTKKVTLRYLGTTDFAKGKGEWAGIDRWPAR